MKTLTIYEKGCLLLTLILSLGMLGQFQTSQENTSDWRVQDNGGDPLSPVAYGEIQEMLEEEPVAQVRDLEQDPISLNQATLEELELLPGIGTVRAQAILAHRVAQGNFASLEEVMEVSGIGEGIFAGIQDYVVLD